MSCMSYTCYTKLKIPSPLQNVHVLSAHSATGHDLCPMGIMHCKIVLGDTLFMHTFIVWKYI